MYTEYLPARPAEGELEPVKKLAKPFLIFFAVLALFFVSCEKESEQSSVPEKADDPVFSEYDDPGKLDYEEFTLVFFTERDGYDVNYIDADGEISDSLSSAIASRNAVVKEKLNAKVRIENTKSLRVKTRTEILAGKTEFNAILARGTWLSELAKEGLLLDLTGEEKLSLGSSFWDQNANKQLMVGGALYFTNCAFNIRSSPVMLYYNEDLFEQNGLTSPRVFLEKNEWTLDNFLTIIRAFSPADGDDLRSENVPRSIQITHSDLSAFLYGCGIRETTNVGNKIKITLPGEKTDEVFAKISSLYGDSRHAFCVSCSSVDVHERATKYDYMRYLFTQDLYLFCIASSDVSDFGEMRSRFGVAPIPNYDASQEEYYALYPREEVLFALPIGAEDPGRTADIVRELNRASETQLLPAWENDILTYAGGVNTDSIPELQTVLASFCYDLGILYDFGGIHSEVMLLDPARNKFSEAFEERQPVISAQIEDFSDLFR